jgi:MraZ protein
MFLGAHAPKLDDKGRVILPAKFRDELAAGIVVTRGQENCLYVFTSREFESLHAHNYKGRTEKPSLTTH